MIGVEPTPLKKWKAFEAFASAIPPHSPPIKNIRRERLELIIFKGMKALEAFASTYSAIFASSFSKKKVFFQKRFKKWIFQKGTPVSTKIHLRNFKKSTLFQTYPKRNKRNCSSQSTPNSLLCLSSCIINHPTGRMACPQKHNPEKYSKNCFHFFQIFKKKKREKNFSFPHEQQYISFEKENEFYFKTESHWCRQRADLNCYFKFCKLRPSPLDDIARERKKKRKENETYWGVGRITGSWSPKVWKAGGEGKTHSSPLLIPWFSSEVQGLFAQRGPYARVK